MIEPAYNMTPERLFDRAWAFTLLDRVLGVLAAEYAGPDRTELFNELKVVLTEGKGAVRSGGDGGAARHVRECCPHRNPPAAQTLPRDS